MTLTESQIDTLLRPIKPHRVFQSQGHSHVPAYDVTAHLTRVFGFGGWDKEIVSLDIVHERSTPPTIDPANGQPKDQGRWWVTYSCRMRLTIKDPQGQIVGVYEDAATGSAQNMPSPADAYDFAIKNAVSYALKRCAKDLGDQFGLSLYNKGQTKPLLGQTLVRPVFSGRVEPPPEDVEANAPVPESMGNDERPEDTPDLSEFSDAPFVSGEAGE